MIFKHIERLGATRHTMLNDYTCLDAVSKRIENIGEIVYGRLSEKFKDKHTEIDWHIISGMRHRLVHQYQDAKSSSLCLRLYIRTISKNSFNFFKKI